MAGSASSRSGVFTSISVLRSSRIGVVHQRHDEQTSVPSSMLTTEMLAIRPRPDLVSVQAGGRIPHLVARPHRTASRATGCVTRTAAPTRICNSSLFPSFIKVRIN